MRTVIVRAAPMRAHAFPLRHDELAEMLGERFLMAATSAEEVIEDVRGETAVEEIGGPFVVEDGPERGLQ